MKLQKMYEMMGGRLAALLAVASAAISGSAANSIFPNAGGNLASASEWGGARPTSSDTVEVNKTGTYTLSEDLSFYRLTVTAGDCTFNFGDSTFTAAIADSGKFSFDRAANSGHTVFGGGTFNFAGGRFNAADGVSDAWTEISNGATVYAGILYVLLGDGQDNKLEIDSGAKLYISNRMYSDSTGTGSYGGQSLVVRGAGSLFRSSFSDISYVGFQRSSNLLRIADGAEFSFSNDSGGLVVGWNAAATNNCMLIENGATAVVPKLLCRSGLNTIFVSNATLTCSSELNLAYNQDAASNNVFRAYGADASLTLPAGDFFGDRVNRGNTVSIEGGVVWDGGNRYAVMARTCNSTFRIAGAGTVVGNASKCFCVGDRINYATIDSVSNRLEVLGGATLNASSVAIMGVGNELCISNATLNLGDDSVGLRVGWRISGSPSTNCVLVMKGSTPKIRSAATADKYACVFANGATLRFEIPPAGYAKGFVPIEVDSQFDFASDADKLEIECEDFVARTGGKLHLIHAGYISDATANRLKACAVPKDCTIMVSGGDVYLKSPSRIGFFISFR